jgi:hypothetical protein
MARYKEHNYSQGRFISVFFDKQIPPGSFEYTLNHLIDEEKILDKVKVTADSGYHSEANMKMVMTEGIDAYIPDPNFRKRDPRFADVDRYKERFRKDLREYKGKHRAAGEELFKPNRDFTMSADQRYCICPAVARSC